MHLIREADLNRENIPYESNLNEIAASTEDKSFINKSCKLLVEQYAAFTENKKI